MGLPFYAWIGSLMYAFSMDVIFHAWNQICVRSYTAHDNSTSGTQHFRFKLLYETPSENFES